MIIRSYEDHLARYRETGEERREEVGSWRGGMVNVKVKTPLPLY